MRNAAEMMRQKKERALGSTLVELRPWSSCFRELCW